MEVTLNRSPIWESGVKPVVENISWIPDVLIERNLFEAIPTRGVLVSSSGKVNIRENVFSHIEMPAIYISSDANGWYESGPVKDVLIESNLFRNSRSHAVLIVPTNTVLCETEKVHSNIRIVHNEMIHTGHPIVSLKSTDCALVSGNRVKYPVFAVQEASLVEIISSYVREEDNSII